MRNRTAPASALQVQGSCAQDSQTCASEPRIASGDGWTLHLGDCIAGMQGLPDDAVDVVITDPPYESESHTLARRTKLNSKVAHAPGKLSWKERAAMGDSIAAAAPLPFSPISEHERAESAAQLARLSRRWILVFCQAEAAQKWACELERNGAGYVRTMIWVKPDGQPQFTGDRPGVGYESIVVAHRGGRKRWNGGGRTGVFTFAKFFGDKSAGPAPHPTTKPLPLMRELVELFSDPDELILDPFAGSGSTGVACRQLGRRFVGWELNRDYFDIACRRLRGDEAKPGPEQPSLLDWGAR